MTTLRSLASAGILTAVLALLPGAALADHDERRQRTSSWRSWNEERHERRDDRHERRDDRYERRDDRHERRLVQLHRHGPSCGHRDVRFYSPVYSRLYNPFGAVHHRPWPAPFFCRPCGHYFRDRNHLHEHAHLRHSVPLWAVPGFVRHVGPGWIFEHD